MVGPAAAAIEMTRWIFDSGSGNDLISRKEILRAGAEHRIEVASVPLRLRTANGECPVK